MGGFKLDTSGEVAIPAINAMTGEPDRIWIGYRWSDLSPFAQGYIEAAFGGLLSGFSDYERKASLAGFRHLAPATLAAMLEDCERFASDPRCESALGKSNGSALWTLRKMGAGDTHGFPPVTLYLADDGKVHQREDVDA